MIESKIHLDKYVRIFWICIFVICVYSCVSSYSYMTTIEKSLMTNTIEKIEKDVDEKLNTVAQELNKVFNGDEVSVNKIAAELSLGELALNKLPGRLKSALEENNYLAIGAHFSDSYDKKILRKSLKGYEVNTETKKELYTVFIKGGNEGKSTQFPYDYTDKNSGRNVDWYSESLGLGGGMVRILVVQMTTI